MKFTAVALLIACGAICAVDARLRGTKAPAIPAIRSYAAYKSEPWGQQPAYYQQINEGRYDNVMTSDVSFATSNADYGVLGQAKDNIVSANPHILRFEIIREQCPAHFVEYFLRKANQLRSRHQAGPLSLSSDLSNQAQKQLSGRALNRPVPRNPNLANITVSSFAYKQNSPGVTNILVDAENMAKKFYLDGVTNYRAYGKVPSAAQLKQFHDFGALVFKSASKVGVACTIVQRGVGAPVVNKIVDDVQVLVYYGHEQSGKSFAVNVLPPGYFDWDGKAIIKQETEVNLNAKNYGI